MVGGIEFDRLGEEAYGFIKLAGGEGIVALLFEFFSHVIAFVLRHVSRIIFHETYYRAITATSEHPSAAAPSLISASTAHGSAWRRGRTDRIQTETIGEDGYLRFWQGRGSRWMERRRRRFRLES